jgi:hypothetical protein
VDFIGLPDHFDVIASRPRFRVAPPSGGEERQGESERGGGSGDGFSAPAG